MDLGVKLLSALVRAFCKNVVREAICLSVRLENLPHNLVRDHWHLGNGGSNQWDNHVCPVWWTRTMSVDVWLGGAG